MASGLNGLSGLSVPRRAALASINAHAYVTIRRHSLAENIASTEIPKKKESATLTLAQVEENYSY